MAIPPDEALRRASRALSAGDHPGTIRSHYPFWDKQYRPYLLKAVEALPRARFDFEPRPEVSTAQLRVVHLAEAEPGWVHQVVAGGSYEEWVVPHDDPTQGWKCVVEAPDPRYTLHGILDHV